MVCTVASRTLLHKGCPVMFSRSRMYQVCVHLLLAVYAVTFSLIDTLRSCAWSEVTVLQVRWMGSMRGVWHLPEKGMQRQVAPSPSPSQAGREQLAWVSGSGVPGLHASGAGRRMRARGPARLPPFPPLLLQPKRDVGLGGLDQLPPNHRFTDAVRIPGHSFRSQTADVSFLPPLQKMMQRASAAVMVRQRRLHMP